MSALNAVMAFSLVSAYIMSALNRQLMNKYHLPLGEVITCPHNHLHISDPRPQLNRCFCRGCHTTFCLIIQATVCFPMAGYPKVPLKKIFDHRQSENGTGNNQPPLPELPNQTIEVKLQLRRQINNTDLQTLQNDLRQHNMNRVTTDPDTKGIIVTGIPPVNGFDAHTVLLIVQRRDPDATLLSSRNLS